MTVDPVLVDLPRRIDHTLLRADAGLGDIRNLCDEAREFGFFSVCVNPVWVAAARECLVDSEAVVISVAGFPLGATRSDIKVAEAFAAAEDGAIEIDMVANIGWLRDGDLIRAEADIRKVRRNLPNSVGLKVILEANLLNSDQLAAGVECAVNSGAQFVKTGTGFSGPCAVEQVQNLVQAARGRIKVKAAGRIRSLAQCRELLLAGADRIGSSASVEIMREFGAS
jgi:deoxyribose-phosphate aldolase